MSDTFESTLCEGLSVGVQKGDWGKGVHARGGVKKGEVLWHERPVVVGSCRSGEGVTCANCFAATARHPTDVTPLPAVPAACASALDSFTTAPNPPEPIPCDNLCEYYCSETCRTEAHRNHHSFVCSPQYAALPSTLATTLGEKSANQRLLALKLLTASVTSTDPKIQGHIEALVPLPYEVSKEEDQRAVEQEVYDAFEKVLPEEKRQVVSFEKYLLMLSKMKANAVELDMWLKVEGDTETYDEQRSAVKASGLFALQAFVNHSCTPNGHRVVYNGALHFVAVEDIPEGEQVLMAYVNPANTIKERQAKLNTHWHITCFCVKCTGETMKLVLFRQLLDGLKKKKTDPTEEIEEAAQDP